MADNKNEIHTYTGSKPFAFISYSHDDLDIISEYLGAIDENYRFWYDEGIKSGAEWVEEIGNKIFDCDIFIVFLSKSALQSHYIKDEITYAYKYAKKMMAVLLEPVSLPRSLELMLGRFQYINFYEENTFDDRLLMFIQGIPDSVRRSETDTDFPADSSSDENSAAENDSAAQSGTRISATIPAAKGESGSVYISPADYVFSYHSFDTLYEIFVGGENTGAVQTGLGGKLSVSVETANADAVDVKVVKA